MNKYILIFAKPFQCFGIVSDKRWHVKHNPIKNNIGLNTIYKTVSEKSTQILLATNTYIKKIGLKIECVIKFLCPLLPPNKKDICFSIVSGFLYIKSRVFLTNGIQIINSNKKSIKFIKAAKR